jgi:hypothetical protein
MLPHLWWGAAALALTAMLLLLRTSRRTARVRDLVLEKTRRTLMRGVIEVLPGRGPQLRGRIGQLEVTVDLHEDPERRRQSPMWRVMAVGPVRLQRPIEAHVWGWEGWIDPWTELGEILPVPAGPGPAFTVHSEARASLDHPLVTVLRRQPATLAAGALLARPDLMRAEVRFRPRAEDNRSLIHYLHAMTEVAEGIEARAAEDATRSAIRLRRLNGTLRKSG